MSNEYTDYDEGLDHDAWDRQIFEDEEQREALDPEVRYEHWYTASSC